MSSDQLLSVNTFNADGVRTDWQFNFSGINPDNGSGTVPYLYPADVKARELFDDEQGIPQIVERTGTLIQPNEFRIGGAPVAAGHQVQIYRATEIRFPLVDYRDRQTVSEFDLDLSSRQGLFVAMEVFDAATIASESANAAEQVASEARALATTAVATADAATATANTALSTAGAAVTTADAADAKADTAIATANQAAADAAAVESLANQAAADAAAASASASSAAADAATAVGVATAVDGKADTALANSATALANANTALSTANAIDAKATTALADSATALATADGIADTANTALVTANAAVTQANTAIDTANTAIGTANTASTAAAAATGAVAALDAEVVKTVVAGEGAGVSRTGSEVTVSMLSGVPLFSVFWWPQRAAIPAGYVAADGQTLSRLTYPDAWAGIQAGNVPIVAEATWNSTPTARGKFTTGDGSTTFRLPDYNGKFAGSLGAVFLRGDGALSGAVSGAIQQGAMQGHGHASRFNAAGANSGTTTTSVHAFSATNGLGVMHTEATSLNTRLVAGPISDGVNGTPNVASETRPLNVTGCWVIKLFGAVVNVGSADAAQLASDYANLIWRTSTVEVKVTALEAGIKQLPELLWSGNVGSNGVVLNLSRPLVAGDMIWLQHSDAAKLNSHPVVLTSELLAGGRATYLTFASGGYTGLIITNASQLTTNGLTAGYGIEKVYASRAKT